MRRKLNPPKKRPRILGKSDLSRLARIEPLENRLLLTAGDLDGNGKVGFEDAAVLVANFGQPASPAEGDIDLDGVVSFSDYSLLTSNYGSGDGVVPALQDNSRFQAFVDDEGNILVQHRGGGTSSDVLGLQLEVDSESILVADGNAQPNPFQVFLKNDGVEVTRIGFEGQSLASEGADYDTNVTLLGSIEDLSVRYSDTTGQVYEMPILGTAPMNTPPVAVGEAFEIEAGDILTVAAPGVLANDTDADGDTITAFLLSTPNSGVVELGESGAFSYTSHPGFVGVDSFTYAANDGQSDSNPATVDIVVLPTVCELTVTNTSDSGSGSLRNAIECANNAPGLDTISFNIPGAGPHDIAPLSALPTITDPVIIDGYSQTGATPNTNPPTSGSNADLQITLSGSQAGGGANGLTITSGNSTVQGLVISDFHGIGIEISGAGGNRVQGSFIGTDVTGSFSRGNSGNGVRIFGSSTSNIIGTDGDGSADAAEGNVIAANDLQNVLIFGNSTKNIIAGNLIGTNAAGSVALSNGSVGVDISDGSSFTQIGTDGDGVSDDIERNIISGNVTAGVRLRGNPDVSDTAIAGNMIGTDVSGSGPIPNHGIGVQLLRAVRTRIGTNGDGLNDDVERNVISGNTSDGIHIAGQPAGDSQGENVVAGNLIGLSENEGFLGNGDHGIRIGSDNFDNRIGGIGAEGNVIAFNRADGVNVEADTSRATITRNSIYSNEGLGIDLGGDGVTTNDPGDGDLGANLLQNFPVVESAMTTVAGTTVFGTLDSTPNSSFVIEFFENATADATWYGEGENFIGSIPVVTDANGDATFTLTMPTPVPIGQLITATATDALGNTSEFSPPKVTTFPEVTFTAESYSDAENAGTSTVVTLERAVAGNVADVLIVVTGGTAQGGGVDFDDSDFPLTVRFDSHELTKVIEIPITDDDLIEPDESITLQVSAVSGASVGSRDFTNLEILDDDTPPPPNTAPTALNMNQYVAVAEGARDREAGLAFFGARSFAKGTYALSNILIEDPDAALTPSDDGELVSATLTLSDPTAGRLTVSAYGFGETYDPATGVWSIEGNLFDVNEALGAVQFVPDPFQDFDETLTIVTHVEDESGAGPEDGLITIEIPDTTLGEMQMWTGDFIPPGWLPADGRWLRIEQHQALFELFGTTYGGDGISTFALPDMRGRVPMGVGSAAGGGSFGRLGDLVGSETIRLTVEQLPPHSHPLRATNSAATQTRPSDHVVLATASTPQYLNADTTVTMSSDSIGEAGSGAPVSVVQPSSVTSFLVAIAGRQGDAVATSATATNLRQFHVFPEDTERVPLDDIAISSLNVDYTEFLSSLLEVTLRVAAPSQGSLTASSGNDETYDPSTGVWKVQGTLGYLSTNDIQAALDDIEYIPNPAQPQQDQLITIEITPDEPTFGPQWGSILLWSDATAPPIADEIEPPPSPNTAPTALNMNQYVAVAEGARDRETGLAFLGTRSFAKGTYALSNIIIEDPDAALISGDDGEFVSATLTLSDPTAGRLTVSAYGFGETYDPATGVWSIEGNLFDVNEALGAVQFVPDPFQDFDETLTIVTHVEDESGAGPEDGLITIEIPDTTLGEMQMWTGDFVPPGWLPADGRSLRIKQHQALFELFGTTYGGDGISTFALPDMRGRVPMGGGESGSFGRLGDLVGSETIRLTVEQLPPHSHPLRATNSAATSTQPSGNVLATAATPPVFECRYNRHDVIRLDWRSRKCSTGFGCSAIVGNELPGCD